MAWNCLISLKAHHPRGGKPAVPSRGEGGGRVERKSGWRKRGTDGEQRGDQLWGGRTPIFVLQPKRNSIPARKQEEEGGWTLGKEGPRLEGGQFQKQVYLVRMNKEHPAPKMRA